MGGAERYARDLLAALSPEFEPLVIGTSREVVEYIARGRPDMPTFVVSPVTSRHDFASIARLARLIGKLDPDVVHVNQHLWSGQYAVLASALARVPSVCVVHGTPPAKSAGQHYLTMVSSRLARKLVGVCTSVAESITVQYRLSPARVTSIYNGVTIPPDSVIAPMAAYPTVAGVGRLAREKGFDVLIEAVAQLSDCNLVLIGDGPAKLSLELLAANLGISDRVEFLGWLTVPWMEVLHPHVLAVPSRNEALGLAPLEAMSIGVPLVAARVGGTSELVLDGVTGTLVEPEDPTALAAAIEVLLRDRCRSEKLGKAGRDRVRTSFAFEKMRGSYEALYREVARPLSARRRESRQRTALRETAALLASKQRNPTRPLGKGCGGHRKNFRELLTSLPPEWRGTLRTLAMDAAARLTMIGLAGRRVTGRAQPKEQVDGFILANIDAVQGRVFETRSRTFAEIAKAAGAAINAIDVWDSEPRNLDASLLIDLTGQSALGCYRYDCEIVVGAPWKPGQAERVLRNLWQALAPDGSLLLTFTDEEVCREGGRLQHDPAAFFAECLPDALVAELRHISDSPRQRGLRAKTRSAEHAWYCARITRALSYP
ncbi:MAG: glycosyltransferase family 4 protein [Acidimicrobiales bacterium]